MAFLFLWASLGTTFAQVMDDAYKTPAQIRKERAERQKEYKEYIVRQAEQNKELKARYEAEQTQAQAFYDSVTDWYNRKGMTVSIAQMESNLDKLENNRSATVLQGGEYTKRLRRFHSRDGIVLTGVDKVYVLDDMRYDPWSDSYYGYDNYSRVNVSINYGYPYSPYGWGSPYSWGPYYGYYPWYNYGWGYGRWYDPWYYNRWYGPYWGVYAGWYDPWYYPTHWYGPGIVVNNYYPQRTYAPSARSMGSVGRLNSSSYGNAVGRQDAYGRALGRHVNTRNTSTGWSRTGNNVGRSNTPVHRSWDGSVSRTERYSSETYTRSSSSSSSSSGSYSRSSSSSSSSSSQTHSGGGWTGSSRRR